MKVAVLCENSGKVRQAFRRQGHAAYSFDLLPDDSAFHTQGDPAVFDPNADWDLVIAHPPCTYLANSGVRWLHSDPERWDKMRDGAAFFKWCLDLPVQRIAVENPIMHGYAVEIVGRKADQYVQPWQFGHGESKRTGFWLKNLSPLEPTDIVEGREGRIWKLPPSEDRWKLRSETYQGIADAMAEQWGS